MRERGPLEYDKFTLNIFQYVNMVNFFMKQTDSDEFKQNISDFDKIYKEILALSDTFYLKYVISET